MGGNKKRRLDIIRGLLNARRMASGTSGDTSDRFTSILMQLGDASRATSKAAWAPRRGCQQGSDERRHAGYKQKHDACQLLRRLKSTHTWQKPEALEMLRILPARCAAMWGNTACVTASTPVTLVSSVDLMASRGTSAAGPSWNTPALLIRMSMLPLP